MHYAATAVIAVVLLAGPEKGFGHIT